jgi:hypothetical protein
VGDPPVSLGFETIDIDDYAPPEKCSVVGRSVLNESGYCGENSLADHQVSDKGCHHFLIEMLSLTAH